MDEIEERLLKKEDVLDHKHEDVEKLRADLDSKVTSIKQLRDEVESIYKLQSQQLEKIAAMSKEEAREMLLQKVEVEAKEDIIIQIKKRKRNCKILLMKKPNGLWLMLLRDMQPRLRLSQPRHL